jgi:hypothetical protein
MMLKYAIALAILLILAAVFTWAFLPARYLPGNRARHLRIRLHLRLHPGKGFARIFGLWLRWGRLAVLRRSGRIRPSLPLWYRIAEPCQHSVFLGRAHYRHAPAHRASPVLPGEQAQGVAVERGFDLLAPFGPVSGQGWVIGGCRALDRHVPPDGRPGELDQVGAAVAVAEHPAVVPELAVLAEVPADDPALRLVVVAPRGPLVQQLPQVVIKGAEYLG